MATNRQGTFSRGIIAEEPSGPANDTGITAAYVMPLSGMATFGVKAENIPIPLYTGDRGPDGNTWGNNVAQGNLPLNFDFLFSGRVMTYFFGRGDYSRPTTAALHRWVKGAGTTAMPSWLQIENQWKETTEQDLRHRGVMLDTIPFKQNLKGAVTYAATAMGIGDSQETSLIPGTVATVTNDGPFLIPNYFNGFTFINGLQCQPKDFSLTLKNNLTRNDIANNGGIASGFDIGKFEGPGKVKLNFKTDGTAPESNFNFLNWARNQVPITYEWWLFNAATTAAWTAYFRIRMWVNFLQNTPGAGGKEARETEQDFVLAGNTTCTWNAEVIAPAPGPYTLPATPNLGIKSGGGATITTALTAGSQTAAQIATALNANGAFSAVATADSIAGALRITSKTSASLQIDGTVTNSAHTAIGLSTVTQANVNGSVVIADMQNSLSSSY